jgi:hypothetical protein
MQTNDFYQSQKWCDCCGQYVNYLASLDHSYCIACGAKVRLFSAADWQGVVAKLETNKAEKRKGGRPRKLQQVG